MFVGYSSTWRKKERAVSAERATRDRTGEGTDGKRRRTSKARRNGKLDGQTGAAGEQRATKRGNGTGETKRLAGWRAAKRENAKDGTETSIRKRATNGKPG